MKSKTSRFILPVSLLSMLFAVSTASAQDSTTAVPSHPGLIHSVIASIIFGLVGIVLAIVGFKLFDLITPFNLEKEICQEKNIAVGILCAAIVLGICHIIAASMS